MSGARIVVQSLLGQSFYVPLSFGCAGQNQLWEPFVVSNTFVQLNSTDCGLEQQKFVAETQRTVWYSYQTETLQRSIPLLGYVEYNEANGDRFYSGNIECSLSYVSTKHVLPKGYSVLTLESQGRKDVKWRQRSVGTQSQLGKTCQVSIAELEGAIGVLDGTDKLVVIVPEEEWHAFVSLIFVGLGLVYLIGDMNILDDDGTIDTLEKANWKKLFILDGPLTALASTISIVLYEADSYAATWIVAQQSVFVAGVAVNFAALLWCLYLQKKNPTPLRLLRMYVDVPIFLAILVPVMHASGNLLELGCIVTNIMTTYVAYRHLSGKTDLEVTTPVQRLVHQSVAIFNMLFISPTILLTIIHQEVGGIITRILVALSITVGLVATAA